MIHFNRVPEYGNLTGVDSPTSFDEAVKRWNRPRGLFFFLTNVDDNKKFGCILRVKGWAFIVSCRPGTLFNRKRKTFHLSHLREDSAEMEQSLRFDYPGEYK